MNYKMVPTNEFELVVHNSFKLPKTKLKSYGLVQSDHKYCEYMVIPNPRYIYKIPKIKPAKNRIKNNSIEKKSPYSPIK